MLPKQNAIRYELVMPSTNKKYKFRPFTVREEKAMLLAKESEDLNTKLATIKTVIEACLEPKVDADTLSSFDIQYVMISLRTKSVGENVRIGFECGQCASKEPIIVDLDLTKIEVIKTEGHNNKIPLFDDVGVIMKYPTLQQIELLEEVDGDPIKVIDLFADLIDIIYDSNELFHASEERKEDLLGFVEDLTQDQFAKIGDFVKTMPRVVHHVKFQCPACGFQHDREIEGFSSFFF